MGTNRLKDDRLEEGIPQNKIRRKDMDFQEVYRSVQGIVRRCYKDYYLHLWESSDWEQEGMLALYELVKSRPALLQDKTMLYRCFKAKFRNRIHDKIRRQESQKRKLDKAPYEEVSEIGHKLRMKEMYLDELVAFRSAMAEYRSGLSPEEYKQYERLMADERFKGRKAMLRDLSEHLRDFNPRE